MAVEVADRWVTFPNGEVEVGGYFAAPADPGGWPGLVVVPENLGLTDHRQAETRELASHGWAVLAVNQYSRLGGSPPAGQFATPEDRRRANFLAMPDEQVVGDIIAAAEWLRAQPSASGELGLLGFCSGGSQALVAACTHPGEFSCLVSIYGNVIVPPYLTADRRPLSRIPLAHALSCPFQGHYGEEDTSVPIEDVDALEAEMREHDRDAEFFRYPGAGHVFADPNHPNYDPEATRLMWTRVHEFLVGQLAGARSG